LARESVHYFGKYILEKNYLTFIDDKIEEKTDYQITRNYKLNTKTHRFEALEKGFQKLKIR